jgi:alkylation response protein AidB-like acyl-CoA dehydrogenase
MDDATFARLSALERAEFLHASTLQRPSETLERHAARIALLEQLIAGQQAMQQQLLDVSTRLTASQERLDTILQAIKDLLDRPPNGR